MITFVGSDIQHTNGATVPFSETLVQPVHQADDFGLIYGFADAQSALPTLSVINAAGWSVLTDVDNLEHSSGRDRINFIATKFYTSSSEADPAVQVADVNEQMSCSLHVFRGVDTANPLDTSIVISDGADLELPTNPAITTVTDNAAIVLLHGANDNDHNSAGAPAGYTLGASVMGSSITNRQHAVAYLLDAGSAGLKTPGVWTHNVDGANTSDYSVFTLALRPAGAGSSVSITSVNGGTNEWNDGDTNISVIGSGFVN